MQQQGPPPPMQMPGSPMQMHGTPPPSPMRPMAPGVPPMRLPPPNRGGPPPPQSLSPRQQHQQLPRQQQLPPPQQPQQQQQQAPVNMSVSIDYGLERYGWYQAQATRASAEEYLSDGQRKVPGNFVVRPSSMAEALALSVVVRDGSVAHSIIRRTETGFVVKLDDEVSPPFPTVLELLESIKPHVEVAVAVGLLGGSNHGDGEDSSFESE